MKSGPFRVFVGVDQTGAAAKGGLSAKPLPCAILVEDHLRLSFPDQRKLEFKAFTVEELTRTFKEALGLNEKSASRLLLSGRTALVVDSVFGLAEAAWPKTTRGGSESLWPLFVEAAQDTRTRQGFGMKQAAEFYSQLLNRSGRKHPTVPVRRCEIVSGANSIFLTRPYQKNIQCGTYRIWRDLGTASEPWLRIWNFEDDHRYGSGSRPWLFEGYPSLMWREVFGFRTRQPKNLPAAIRERTRNAIQITKKDAEIVVKNADWADAAALAAGSWILQREGVFKSKRRELESWRRHEGWILGLTES